MDDMVTAKTADVRRFDAVDGVDAAEFGVEQLDQLQKIANVDLALSIDQLERLAVSEINAAQAAILRAGAYLIALKEKAGHGGFSAAIERIGIAPRTAREAMQIATWVAKLPPDQAARVVALPKSKIVALASVEPEVLGDLLADGSVDGDEPLSVRELRQRLRDEQTRRADADARLRARETELRNMERASGYASMQMDRVMAATRDQAVHLLERIAHELSILGRMAADVLVDGYDVTASDAADREAVAQLIYHALRGSMAVADGITAGIGNTFGGAVTGGVVPSLQYPPEFAARLRALRDAAMSAAESDHQAVVKQSRKANKVMGRHS